MNQADDQGSVDEVGATGQACFYHGWKDSHQFSAVRVLGIVVVVGQYNPLTELAYQ